MRFFYFAACLFSTCALASTTFICEGEDTFLKAEVDDKITLFVENFDQSVYLSVDRSDVTKFKQTEDNVILKLKRGKNMNFLDLNYKLKENFGTLEFHHDDLNFLSFVVCISS